MKAVLSIALSIYAALAFSQPTTKKAVFIILDGIPADVIEKVNTPNLDRIANTGKYMHAYVGGLKDSYNQTPTISAVSYNSLLTGTWVNKHNVWDNDIKEPNYNYQNIFRLFNNQYPDKKTAIFSSWTDNRTKLVGEGLKEAGNVILDEHHDGYELDTMRFPQDKQRDFMHKIDEQVTTDAAKSIKENAPDLSWVYLEYTDDIGHMYGDSEEFSSSVEKMDKQIGRIWDAIEFRRKNHKEEWMIIITTDHGRDAKTGKGHGGQSDRERKTWITTNLSELNNYALNHQPAIVDIMPTIARFTGISLPEEINRELDGVSLIGKVSLIEPVVANNADKLTLSWKSLDKVGKVKIWIATTNNFKTGGKDRYQLLAEVPVQDEKVMVNIKNRPSEFYKIVLEGSFNTVNQWIFTGK